METLRRILDRKESQELEATLLAKYGPLHNKELLAVCSFLKGTLAYQRRLEKETEHEEA